MSFLNLGLSALILGFLLQAWFFVTFVSRQKLKIKFRLNLFFSHFLSSQKVIKKDLLKQTPSAFRFGLTVFQRSGIFSWFFTFGCFIQLSSQTWWTFYLLKKNVKCKSLNVKVKKVNSELLIHNSKLLILNSFHHHFLHFLLLSILL